MRRVLVLVEGQTEERFIKNVVYKHLLEHDVLIVPKIIMTKRVKSGKQFKGGVDSYTKIRNDLIRLFHDKDADCITTMIDYYGPKRGFPGLDSEACKRSTSGLERVRILEEAFRADINEPRFLPYLQLHEFEALLFSDAPSVVEELRLPEKKEQELLNILGQFATPEDINDQPETCPSRRLKNLKRGYQKVLDGTLLANRIGIRTIREQCPHFSEWLTQLESL